MDTQSDITTPLVYEGGTTPEGYKQTPEQLIEDWAPQMVEHALFLYQMLVVPSLKNRARENVKSWSNYLCNDQEDNEDLRRNLKSLKELKLDVIDIVQDPKFVGFGWLSFVDHILRELDYFQNKLNGRIYTPQEELEFWNTIMADHVAFASHLLDPDERAKTIELIGIAEQTYRLPIDGSMASLMMALDSGTKLDKANRELYDQVINGEIRSIISPDLLYHVIREGQMGNNIIKAIVQRPQSAILDPKPCDHALQHIID